MKGTPMARIFDDTLRGQLGGQDCTITRWDIDTRTETYPKGWAPDKSWEHVDDEGHIHRWYGRETPTLVYHDGWDDVPGWWECVWCGEAVTRAVSYDSTMVTIPTLHEFSAKVTLDGEQIFKVGTVVLLTCDQFAIQTIIANATYTSGWLPTLEAVGCDKMMERGN